MPDDRHTSQNSVGQHQAEIPTEILRYMNAQRRRIADPLQLPTWGSDVSPRTCVERPGHQFARSGEADPVRYTTNQSLMLHSSTAAP